MLDRETVLESLRAIERKDPNRKVFGASGHQYKLNPPIDLAALEAFEASHKIFLPDDYKYFISEISNGGAGPFYGVFPLGMQDGLGNSLTNWGKGLVGDVSSPFRHTTDWNLPASFWERAPNPEAGISPADEDWLMEAWDHEIEENYWNPKIMNGAIPICHVGCALRRWLVVAGHEKGKVWWDHRADHRGIGPVTDATGKHSTFSQWYQSWMDDPHGHTKIL